MVDSVSGPENGKYRENVESVRVPKIYAYEYRKMVESVSRPENGRIWPSTGKGRIRASTEKLCLRVPKNGRISVRT